MTTELDEAERLKFALFETGLRIGSDAARYIAERDGKRALTLADYASTSGVSLRLDGRVWVNAPIATYNQNFVLEPRHELFVTDRRLAVRSLIDGSTVPAEFAPVPLYSEKRNKIDRPFTDYVHTHTDRARISPVQGCAMRCKFCDIPYEFKGDYYAKSLVRLLEASQEAIDDPIQPAQHILISGGTPGKPQFDYLRTVYAAVIQAFKGKIDVDIMMAPIPEVVDIEELAEVGVNELSLNLEIWDNDVAREIMPQKYDRGRSYYLDFIAKAVDRLGPGKVRSILIVGLEDPASTLEGVEALAKIGAYPVLSPFRPDPITELSDMPPPSAALMERVFLQAREIAHLYGAKLGPHCEPCSHNTMTLSGKDPYYRYTGKTPRLI